MTRGDIGMTSFDMVPVDVDNFYTNACDGTLTAFPVNTVGDHFYTAGFMCCPGENSGDNF